MNIEPFALWITGLPGSGKSVISESLKKILKENEISAEILRMDEMRKVVTPDPKYTDEERQLIYNSLVYVAKKLVGAGINVIMDATGNKRRYRKLAYEIIPNFYMIYLKCPLDLAIEREMERKDTRGAPEGIYKKVMEGETENVPGLQSEYEEPKNPDLIVETDKLRIKECADKIYREIILPKNKNH